MDNKLKFNSTGIKGLYVIELNSFEDNRGEFSRLFCLNEFRQVGFKKNIVNINYSKTLNIGDVRGMHYQEYPYPEEKIVKCINGSIFDVAVDMRISSSTYLQYFGIELTKENNKMLYVPEGFAHGFQALSNNAEIIYFNTQFYHPESECGVNILDPAVDIKWPLKVENQSDKDKKIKFI
jgi:dTDP-4-dehydrorhamnose 3,5-epimerase